MARISAALSAVGNWFWGLFGNRRAQPRPPTNYLPNSDGDGGQVVNTGHGGIN